MNSSNFDIGWDGDDANPIFAAQLVPYRSLSSSGFALMMVIVAVICVSNAYFYFHLGAWPVAIFFFFDVALLYAAFKFSYHAGRAREEITISRTALEVRKITPNGRQRKHIYNPFWAKFLVERNDEIGITSMRITGEGYQSTIGAFLNPDDRESFATAFSQALAKAKK
ncbi:DUF2244 domain-containing protein [Ahrensia sp. 13_GOM-1096m]|uniref:DUF2244 domain-containing protein n=1 Tax=Ahrensia sp. 13_GOM-1096m TaxID=1380380 RepID=UPI00047A3820|nr:DUF2244 domain-containing protein [Ahrensia sp. 13_GOM-1096m]